MQLCWRSAAQNPTGGQRRMAVILQTKSTGGPGLAGSRFDLRGGGHVGWEVGAWNRDPGYKMDVGDRSGVDLAQKRPVRLQGCACSRRVELSGGPGLTGETVGSPGPPFPRLGGPSPEPFRACRVRQRRWPLSEAPCLAHRTIACRYYSVNDIRLCRHYWMS